MASILLAEAKKLGLDDLAAGVAETVATTDDFLAILPFNITRGNAYAFNREGTPGNVASLAIGGSTSNVKTQVTYAQKALGLTSIIGDAEVNSLIVAQGVGSSVGVDPVAAAIASKSKQLGREFARQVAVGSLASPGSSVSGVTNGQEFDGIQTIFGGDADFAAQDMDKADAALTLDMLDELLDQIKVGSPSWIMANAKGIRKIRALLRGVSGVEMREIAGRQMLTYNGIPLVRNDFLSADVDGVTPGSQVDIYAGSFDDGSRTGGAAGILTDVGSINVQAVGAAEAGDYDIWRVKMYGGFAIHSPLSVARLKSVTV